MNKNNFHKNFKLNGKSFTSINELLSFVRINASASYSFLFNWFSSDEIQVQTSGSTGKPKVIQLKKEFMINSALATGNFFHLPENTTALLCLSPDYIAGKMMLVRALTLGWQLDLVAPTSKVKINKEYDFSAMVSIQVENSIAEINKIKKLIIGGGVVSEELKNKLQKINTAFFATYGMTETITHIAVKKLNNFNNVTSGAVEKSFYQTLPNVNIYIDSRNCLVIQAPKVSGELVVTNDVVQLVSETQFEWLGRFDNVINSGGIKLHPEKIEEKLSEVIKQRFFVAGISDSTLGEKLILVVEGDSSSVILSRVKNLSKYETPKEIYFVETFVETETKKSNAVKHWI
ncbi:AMP-binding protein [Tenacibaculum aquimarinum]|uniref:AMP-binding protein n=1 Tax=Tenacibaculum aquimarinum TaxID=2910675 RepID=UPI001F0A3B0E|nr:AMP-binding protein [Tenacibaculum aquimarinum]MCH3884739.1 AMP-binding protein [Tenacibaculum aquimarinum]